MSTRHPRGWASSRGDAEMWARRQRGADWAGRELDERGQKQDFLRTAALVQLWGWEAEGLGSAAGGGGARCGVWPGGTPSWRVPRPPPSPPWSPCCAQVRQTTGVRCAQGTPRPDLQNFRGGGTDGVQAHSWLLQESAVLDRNADVFRKLCHLPLNSPSGLPSHL